MLKCIILVFPTQGWDCQGSDYVKGKSGTTNEGKCTLKIKQWSKLFIQQERGRGRGRGERGDIRRRGEEGGGGAGGEDRGRETGGRR